MILEKGRVCIIKRGRDFGKLVMILENPKEKDSTVMVEGLNLKATKKNINHLWIVDKMINSVKDLEKVKL